MILVGLGLSGCGVRPDVGERDKYLTISGNEFRKTGSINTGILWAGVKRSSGVNSFDPKFFPILENEITAPQTTEAFNEQTGTVAFEAAAEAGIEVAEGSISGSNSNEYKVTGNYSIFTLQDVNDFVAELNSLKNRKGIELLMRYDDPRIITSIAIVFNRESSKKVNATGEVSLKIKNPEIGSPETTVKADSTSETVAKLSDGTIFAYEYARICWEEDNGQVRIATIEVDRPGWDDNCPSGTKDNASKL